MSVVSPILEVSNLRKTYNRGKEVIEAVTSLSFEGYAGEILGILGPNGSGKTTTIKSIATIVEYDSGVIRVAGYDNKRERLKVLASLGAVLEGARNIYWTLTPEENCMYFAGLHGLSRSNIRPLMNDMFASLDLDKYRKQQVGQLSKGNQQKVAVCCALIAKPKVVLLDEPTLGLDVETNFHMKKWLKTYVASNNIFVLITSHDMRFIESICDRVIIFKNGSLINSGSIQELRSNFSKRLFKIVIEKPLSEQQKILLAEHQIQFRTELEGDATVLNVLMPQPDLLYDFFDVLRLERQEILSIAINESDLEDIFLSIMASNAQKVGEKC